jgi:hypothetical protein
MRWLGHVLDAFVSLRLKMLWWGIEETLAELFVRQLVGG